MVQLTGCLNGLDVSFSILYQSVSRASWLAKDNISHKEAQKAQNKTPKEEADFCVPFCD